MAILSLMLNFILGRIRRQSYKQLEYSSQQVQASETRLTRILEIAPDGIVIVNKDFRIELFNQSAKKIFEYQVNEVVGQPLKVLIPEQYREQHTHNILQFAHEEETTRQMGLRANISGLRKNGEEFPIEVSIARLRIGNEDIFIAMVRDITSRKEAEKQLQEVQSMLIHADKINALAQMVAGIAHEINNPIAFVNSNLHSLRKSLVTIFDAYSQVEAVVSSSENPALTKQAKMIRQDADLDFIMEDSNDALQESISGLERVAEIIKGLRLFSRLDEAELQTANLEENIRNTLAIASGHIKTRISVTLDLDGLPDIQC